MPRPSNLICKISGIITVAPSHLIYALRGNFVLNTCVSRCSIPTSVVPTRIWKGINDEEVQKTRSLPTHQRQDWRILCYLLQYCKLHLRLNVKIGENYATYYSIINFETQPNRSRRLVSFRTACVCLCR